MNFRERTKRIVARPGAAGAVTGNVLRYRYRFYLEVWPGYFYFLPRERELLKLLDQVVREGEQRRVTLRVAPRGKHRWRIVVRGEVLNVSERLNAGSRAPLVALGVLSDSAAPDSARAPRGDGQSELFATSGSGSPSGGSPP